MRKNIHVLLINSPDYRSESIEHLLTALHYSFVVAKADIATIDSLFKAHYIEVVLLSFDYLLVRDKIPLIERLYTYHKVIGVFYIEEIKRHMLNDIKYHPSPMYLTTLTNKDSLFVNLELARSYHQYSQISQTPFFFIKQNQSYLKVSYHDIAYIQSEHVYLRIYTITNKSFLLRESLNHWALQLPRQFIRCHRGYIVNLEHIIAIHTKRIILSTQDEIPITKSYKQNLLQIIRKNLLTKS